VNPVLKELQMPQHVFTIPQVRELVPGAITAHPPRDPARPSPTQRELVAAAVLLSPVTGATGMKPR
jgi:ectoine hydroxylase-related dioxygenase (phytanoyl-CoA dioxygenase family)